MVVVGVFESSSPTRLRLSLTDRISTGVPTVQLAHQWRTALFNGVRGARLGLFDLPDWNIKLSVSGARR